MKLLIAFISALLLSVPALAQTIGYISNLTGAEQVPPVVTPITGQFIFRTTDNRWFLAVRGAAGNDKITAAHIHCGKIGANGPIVYPFYDGVPSRRIFPKGQFNNSKFIRYQPTTTCPITITNILQLKSAAQDGYLYVNVHTQKNPNGAVRGQVIQIIQQ
jgi:CHRD domain